MTTRRIAHLSDLHFGLAQVPRVAARLCEELIERQVDHVVVTGDVTNRGRAAEYAQFLDIFAPLLDSGRMTIVPGNHDRLGDDVGRLIMDDRRVDVVHRPGLHLVRVDSTAPHNRFLVAGHGALCDRVIAACVDALRDAAPDTLRVVLLHHHVLPAPLETFSERLADLVALPFAEELALGARLLEAIADHADVVLHGHRHQPRETIVTFPSLQPIAVYNAGSSTELGAARLFTHHAGALLSSPGWLQLKEVAHVDHPPRALVGLGARALPLPDPARGAELASA
jgi:3',5'-cyclic AMP phosphodiesterase CpdA